MVILNLKHNDLDGVVRRKIMKKKSNNFKIFVLKIFINNLNLYSTKKILIGKK
jgi:hypothetical protein